jgi:hypothetical protein
MRRKLAASVLLNLATLENQTISTLTRREPRPGSARSKAERYRLLIVAPASSSTAVAEALTLVTRGRGPVDELHVVVPAARADRVRRTLLKPGSASGLSAVCRRLGISVGDIVVGPRTIHGLGSPGDPHDVNALADDTLNILRVLCADENCDITLVAAADAGALGMLARSALELVGRSDDRFFVLEHGSDGSRQRQLIELPMLLAERRLASGQGYHELSKIRRTARQRLQEPGVLVLHTLQRLIRIDEIDVTVPRLQFYWLFCLAAFAPDPLPLRLLSGSFSVNTRGVVLVPRAHPNRKQIQATIARLRGLFSKLFPDSADDFAFVLKRACGESPGLPSAIAKLNGRLKRALGVGATPYLVAGGRGAGGYRLTLPSHKIKLDLPASTPASPRR